MPSPNRLIKLHGTSGSGKSTVARGLISKASENILRDNLHELRLPELDRPLFIIGRYDKVTCGGMDTIQSPEEQIRLVVESAERGHVFYEGLLLSGFYGRIGQASEQFGDDHLFAFLTTPLDTCLARVQERRSKRGTQTAFNPANTIDKFDAILRLRWRLDNGDRCPIRKTAWVSWKDPVAKLMEFYNAQHSAGGDDAVLDSRTGGHPQEEGSGSSQAVDA